MKARFTIPGMLALALVLSSCGRDPSSTGLEYAPQMYHSITLEAYTQIADSLAPFKDKMNMQEPPAGTISRGGWADHPYAVGDTAGHRSMVNPVPLTDDILKEGEVLYLRYCGVCHGPKGEGDGPVAAKDEINPPRFSAEPYKSFTPGEYYRTIFYGKGVMGSYSSQLTYNERWKIIHYVDELLGRHAAAEAPADSAATDAKAPAGGHQ